MIGVLKSLGVTMSTMFRKPVTVEYPSAHKKLPERDRAFPILLYDFSTTSTSTSRSAPAATPASVPARLSA
jgi:hypothetical protein